MKVLIVVPARYESSRFPGKPLIELTGADGKTKSLIQRSWEAAKSVENVDVIVATDDYRIEKAARDFGAEVVMTCALTAQCDVSAAKIVDDGDAGCCCQRGAIAELQAEPVRPVRLVTHGLTMTANGMYVSGSDTCGG